VRTGVVVSVSLEGGSPARAGFRLGGRARPRRSSCLDRGVQSPDAWTGGALGQAAIVTAAEMERKVRVPQRPPPKRMEAAILEGAPPRLRASFSSHTCCPFGRSFREMLNQKLNTPRLLSIDFPLDLPRRLARLAHPGTA